MSYQRLLLVQSEQRHCIELNEFMDFFHRMCRNLTHCFSVTGSIPVFRLASSITKCYYIIKLSIKCSVLINLSLIVI